MPETADGAPRPVRRTAAGSLRAALPVASVVSAAAWGVLVTARGRFWRTDLTLAQDGTPAGEESWPDVVVVVPARDEAEVLPRTLPSLLAQDYPGRWQVVLVDDESTDGTGDVARRLAAAAGAGDRLEVLPALPHPDGWAGKVWAQHCALEHLAGDPPAWVLLTDADIAHPPGSLRELVRGARRRRVDLLSLMALLRVQTPWERLLVPAFVYFFAQLYPFSWVADPRRRTAAAAGGCVLVRWEALAELGALAAVRDALIDDVALAQAVKARGRRTWLGLSREVRSERPYPRLRDVWEMVARSADTQLRHDPLLLAGTVVGLVVTYLVPPVAAVRGSAGVAGALLRGRAVPASCATEAVAGLAATVAMTSTYRPMVRFFGLARRWSLALPGAAALYLGMTVHSAIRHRRGGGATWKGRAYPGGG